MGQMTGSKMNELLISSVLLTSVSRYFFGKLI